MSDDAKLLNDYATGQSEAAFTELVRRHLNLVYSAALRLADGDAHAAQDVTQQVFSELARQASRLILHPALVGWLYTTTRRMSLSARRAQRRRSAREQEANLMNEILREPALQPDWDQLRPVLEEVMHHLGETDRLAVLLRFFQSKSLREVGEALGLSENAARMRVDRALEKVRAQLARKGVTSSAAALGVMLAAHAVSAAPASLAATIPAAALAGVALETASTITLFKFMAITKLKSAAIGAVIVASVATSLVLQQQAQARLRAVDETGRQQADQLAQLQADNERLSNQLARESSVRPDDQVNKLVALRAEAAALRKETNDMVALLTENRRLRAPPPKTEAPPTNPLQAKELLMSKINFGKQAMLAFIMHANDNGGMFPTNFDQAAKYMGGGVPPGSSVTPDQFEIVYHGALNDVTNAADVIVIRELQANPPALPTDKWSRVYAFADGHVEVHASPDGNFDAWEQQHMVLPK
jgi:RNA polymerase sigma factor (sigma-70 family)